MKSYSFHREAEKEYAEAAQYYARISPALGVRFYEEIERLILDIRQRPTLSAFIRKSAGVISPRSFRSGCSTKIGEGVRIVAVMPLRRDPKYWQHRPGVE